MNLIFYVNLKEKVLKCNEKEGKRSEMQSFLLKNTENECICVQMNANVIKMNVNALQSKEM